MFFQGNDENRFRKKEKNRLRTIRRGGLRLHNPLEKEKRGGGGNARSRAESEKDDNLLQFRSPQKKGGGRTATRTGRKKDPKRTFHEKQGGKEEKGGQYFND